MFFSPKKDHNWNTKPSERLQLKWISEKTHVPSRFGGMGLGRCQENLEAANHHRKPAQMGTSPSMCGFPLAATGYLVVCVLKLRICQVHSIPPNSFSWNRHVWRKRTTFIAVRFWGLPPFGPMHKKSTTVSSWTCPPSWFAPWAAMMHKMITS